MAFKPPLVLPDFKKLQIILANSGVQQWNPPLYDILHRLITTDKDSQDVIVNQEIPTQITEFVTRFVNNFFSTADAFWIGRMPFVIFGGYHILPTAASFLSDGEITSAPTVVGTATAQLNTPTSILRRITGTTADGITGFNASVSANAGNLIVGPINMLPVVEFVFKTGAVISSVRYQVGLASEPSNSQGNTGVGTNVDGAYRFGGATKDFIGLVKRQGQTVWEFGSSTTVGPATNFIQIKTQLGANFTVATSTIYRVRFEVLSATSVRMMLADEFGNVSVGIYTFPVWTNGTLSIATLIQTNAAVNTIFFETDSMYYERKNLALMPAFP